MQRILLGIRLLVVLFVLAAGLGLGIGRSDGPADVGLVDLEREGPRYREVRPKLFKGEIPCDPNNKDHFAAVDFEAKWVTYRFYYDDYHGTDNPQRSIAGLIRDFDGDITQLKRGKENTKAAAQLFTKQVIVRAKEVLAARRKPIIQVNVAHVLANLAELGQGELADALVDVLKDDTQYEGVRYWVLKGLQQLMSAPPQDPPVLSKERKEKVIKALIAFISRKTNFLPTTSRAEVEGYRVLRREATAALNNCAIPTLADGAHPALVLMRLMANEGFTPEVRMDERVEATIALARMQPDQDKNYNPDYAVQQIGLFLEQFAGYAQVEGKKERAPCKVFSARMIEALEAMKATAKNPYVTEVVNESLKLLARLEAGNTADPVPLATLVKEKAPPSSQLYKDVKDSTVKPAAE
jgi:hypothetical protein